MMSDKAQARPEPSRPSLARRLISTVRLAGFFVLSAFLVPAIIIAALLSGGRRYWFWALSWASLSLRMFGMRLEVEGRENLEVGKSYVVASNHKSLLDPLSVVVALGPRHQVRWVAKKELLKIPVFGLALRVSGQVMIDRSDRGQAVAEIARMKEKEGVSVAFFAEGARSPDAALLPFKKGPAAFAIDSGWPLLPVAVSGSNLALAKHSLVLRPRTIRVRIGKPIEVGGLEQSDRDTLTAGLRTKIAAMLAELNT